MKLSVSYLSIIDHFEEKVRALATTSLDYLHVDVMDGMFVKNKTKSIHDLDMLQNYPKPLDVHVMVKNVLDYLEEYALLNPTYFTFHIEAVLDVLETIHKIKKKGIMVGISIKPSTSVEILYPYLDLVDLVLVMSVEPGEGGQTFLESSIEKIKDLAYLREENHYHYQIEVDGGINDKTISYCNYADIVVVGSYITKSDDYQKQIDILQASLMK